MGMSIDEARNNFMYSLRWNDKPSREALVFANKIMRKYQKIVQIMERTVDDGTSMYDTLQEIEEVVEDGNDTTNTESN